ncbi:MAG: hypothetical protein R3Y35_07130 [Clostridia bacterium]
MKKTYNNLQIIYSETHDSFDFALSILQETVTSKNYNEDFTINLTKTCEIDEQSYVSQISEGNLDISYSKEHGAMYAILDIADEIIEKNSLKSFKTGTISPYVKNRGIKFNIPLDARSPSYSDEADSAQENIENMWDMDFWVQFIDNLAKNKYNAVSLWSLAPFSSMVKVAEYPLCAIDDVKKTTRPIVSTTEGRGMCNPAVLASLVTVKKITIDEKIAFWQKVMQYAETRCISFYLFTWNLFAHGTENNPYGIDDDQNNPVTTDYFQKAVKTMVETYPLLAGIGVTSGERMTHQPQEDVDWIRETYGKGVELALQNDPERKFKFIHRLQYAKIETILGAYDDFTADFEVSVKYAQAHMHAAIKPVFVDHVLEALPKNVKSWLTVRNDDYYMFRWGSPEFAKNYLLNMPNEDILAGFFMGPDGYTWGKEYISKNKNVYGSLIFDKMDYNFAIWGKMACNPYISDEYFIKWIEKNYPCENSQNIFKAWQLSSNLFSDFQQTHWRDLDYHWNPETCCRYVESERAVWFGDINEFIECVSQRGTDRISVANYCNAVVNGEEIDGVSPLTVAKRLQENSLTALSLIADINADEKINLVLEDIKGMSTIGLYYGLKIEAAVYLLLARKTEDNSKREVAIKLLEKCADVWSDYAEIVSRNYHPQYLTRFKQIIDVNQFIKHTKWDILLAND